MAPAEVAITYHCVLCRIQVESMESYFSRGAHGYLLVEKMLYITPRWRVANATTVLVCMRKPAQCGSGKAKKTEGAE